MRVNLCTAHSITLNFLPRNSLSSFSIIAICVKTSSAPLLFTHT